MDRIAVLEAALARIMRKQARLQIRMGALRARRIAVSKAVAAERGRLERQRLRSRSRSRSPSSSSSSSSASSSGSAVAASAVDVEIVPVLECAVPPPLVVADGPVDVALPVAERVRRVQTRRPLDICPRCWYKHNGWAGVKRTRATSRAGRRVGLLLSICLSVAACRRFVAFVKAAKSAMGDAVSDSD